MALAKINGRNYFINVDTIEITPVSNGRWEVTYDRKEFEGEVVNEGRKFLVVGGTKSGGAADEWFVHHPLFFGEEWLPTNSMVKAIKLGAQY
jgi:hypothetical protein